MNNTNTIDDMLYAEKIKNHGRLATWVIKNYMRMAGHDVTTKMTREAMFRLEAAGVVEHDGISRANCYVWRLK